MPLPSLALVTMNLVHGAIGARRSQAPCPPEKPIQLVMANVIMATGSVQGSPAKGLSNALRMWLVVATNCKVTLPSNSKDQDAMERHGGGRAIPQSKLGRAKMLCSTVLDIREISVDCRVGPQLHGRGGDYFVDGHARFAVPLDTVLLAGSWSRDGRGGRITLVLLLLQGGAVKRQKRFWCRIWESSARCVPNW